MRADSTPHPTPCARRAQIANMLTSRGVPRMVLPGGIHHRVPPSLTADRCVAYVLSARLHPPPVAGFLTTRSGKSPVVPVKDILNG